MADIHTSAQLVIKRVADRTADDSSDDDVSVNSYTYNSRFQNSVT